jgi:hypothetical protein
MRCPTCDGPVDEGISTCPRCGFALTRPPAERPAPDVELVPVFETGDAALVALVKSLLEEEQIDYMVRGDNLQDLFGAGRALIGFNPIVGPVEFLVREEDAARTRALLSDLPA